MELAEQALEFRERGLGLAAISYDSVAVLAHFSGRREIPFPLLSDPSSEVIEAFGLLQPDYPEGHELHGVPFPGMLVIDRGGLIVEKVFEESYRERRTASSVFAEAAEAGEDAAHVVADHFSLEAWVSDQVASPGSRITLALDVEMQQGHHAYAPGDNEYRALALSLDPHPLLRAHETRLPEPTLFHFAPLDETVPVFEGRFRVLKDVTLATGGPMNEAIEADPELKLTGRLDYQVCSERTCYPPSSISLSWSLRVRPSDRQRVPVELREHLNRR